MTPADSITAVFPQLCSRTSHQATWRCLFTMTGSAPQNMHPEKATGQPAMRIPKNKPAQSQQLNKQVYSLCFKGKEMFKIPPGFKSLWLLTEPCNSLRSHLLLPYLHIR